MKRSLLIASLFFLTQSIYSQEIADIVVSSGGKIIALDDRGREIFAKYLGYEEEVVGFSQEIIVTQTPSFRVSVYDKNFEKIVSRYISSDEKVKSVLYNRIIIANARGKIQVYDKFFNLITKQ